jgi:hypothetical protein
MKTFLQTMGTLSLITLLFYSLIGTHENVEEIKQLAPTEMTERNWEIIRYEGWEYGSWNHHGGKVWYHVRNIDNHDIQYRVHVTLWGGELHWTYGAPEKLERVNAKIEVL